MAINRIITAKDYSKAEGADGTVRHRIMKMRQQISTSRGIDLKIFNIDSPRGDMVFARIWQGQWIADCPYCNSAQFVDPDEPIFYCFGCSNRGNGHNVMPVVFPDTLSRKKIETLILERPVDDNAGLTELEQVGLSRPLIFTEVEIEGQIVPLGLARNWHPSESVEDLQKQNLAVKAWKRKNKEVNNGI